MPNSLSGIRPIRSWLCLRWVAPARSLNLESLVGTAVYLCSFPLYNTLAKLSKVSLHITVAGFMELF
jgi:hypothetical protein